jgi:hypothetical protein
MVRGGRLVAALLLALAPVGAFAQITDTAVKAAFLPRFARYVTWPAAARPAAGKPLVLCVIGDDPFGSALNQAIAGQEVDGKSFAIKHLALVSGASDCDIAFVQGSRSQSPAQMLVALKAQPVLTVTDERNGPQRGIIHFQVVNGRVRFFIDNSQAQQRGLAISSRLLALALGVK